MQTLEIPLWRDMRLWLIISLALALRLGNLLANSPWIDELHSMYMANPSHPLAWLWEEVVVKESELPLYFLFLRGWMWLGGSSEAWVRLLSILFGGAGVAAMALLGERLRGRGFALLLAGLTGVLHFHVLHSVQIRFYGLVFALTALSLAAFVRLPRVAQPQAAQSLPHARRHALQLWLRWWWPTALLLCTYHYGAFVVAGLAMAYGLRMVVTRRVLPLSNHLTAFVAFAALTAISIGFILLSPHAQAEALASPNRGLGEGWLWQWNNLTSWFGPTMPMINQAAPLWAAVAMGTWLAAIVLLGIQSLIRWQRASRAEVFVFTLGISVLVVCQGLAVVHTQLAGTAVFARHLMVMVPPAILLLGEVLWSIRSIFWRKTAIAIVLSLFAANALFWPGQTSRLTDQWREALPILAHRADRDPVLCQLAPLYNQMAESMRLKTHAVGLNEPTTQALLSKGQGFWVVRVTYARHDDRQWQALVDQRVAIDQRLDDLGALELTHYVMREAARPLSISAPQVPTSAGQHGAWEPAPFAGWIDAIDSVGPRQYVVKGWARIADYVPPGEVLTELLLYRNGAEPLAVRTFRMRRPDIVADPDCGAEVRLDLSGTSAGVYRLGWRVSDQYRKREAVSGPLGEFRLVMQ